MRSDRSEPNHGNHDSSFHHWIPERPLWLIGHAADLPQGNSKQGCEHQVSVSQKSDEDFWTVESGIWTNRLTVWLINVYWINDEQYEFNMNMSMIFWAFCAEARCCCHGSPHRPRSPQPCLFKHSSLTATNQHLPTPSNTFQHLPTPANIPQHTSTDSWWTYWLHWPTHFWRTCYAHLSSRLQPTHSVMCSTVQPTSEGSGMTTTPHSQNWWDADSKLVKPLWNGVTIMEWDSCSSYQNIITWIITCNIM